MVYRPGLVCGAYATASGELLRGQADVIGRLGQPVMVQARHDLAEALGALTEMCRAQVVAERRAEAGQLAVVGGAGEQLRRSRA